MKKWLAGMIGLFCVMTIVLMAETAEETDARKEARERISPIVMAIDVVDGDPDCGLKSDRWYSLTWQIIAYGEDYNSTVVLFDCSGWDDYYCGNKYTDANRFESVKVVYENKTLSDTWSYRASNGVKVYAYQYDFRAQIHIPKDRDWEGDGSYNGPWNNVGDGGNKIVVRFYQIGEGAPSGADSVSVLIGTRKSQNYGPYGRRIYNYVAEDTDPDNGICPKDMH